MLLNKNGDYISKSTPMSNELLAEWDAWLEQQNDPGHYDAYKDKEPGSPTNGQWKCDVYCPPHILSRLQLVK